MKASDYIVEFIEQHGVTVVFGYIGGMITHLVDSLDKNPGVRFVQTYHEQTASIAAEGYALESKKFGVAIATSGPGATNMMTGIADAYFGSIPVLYITGQVNTYEYKEDKPIRQQGFQETDIVSIVRPVTKYAVMIQDAGDLRYELEKAIHIATSGRKGPVVIDLPMNISRAEIEPLALRPYVPPAAPKASIDYSKIITLINNAERPMLLVGGGCSEDGDEINAFLKHTNMPVVTTLMGRGIIDETYSNYIGMIGSYGNRCANMTIAKTDVLIAIGARLDTRQTGAQIDRFLTDGTIVHVDIDNSELDYNRLSNRIKVNSTVKRFLAGIAGVSWNGEDYARWIDWCCKIKRTYNQDKEIERFVENKSPYKFMQVLNEVTKEGDIITTDIGQNQMWAAQTLKLKKNQRFITSGGLAPMGFSLPVAIGMAFANPTKRIYCLNGDGGFHMAVQSLLLISQYKLDIKVVILNNKALGMITQFQHLYFENRMAGTTPQGGYLTPDAEKLSIAYGLPFVSLEEKKLNRDVLISSPSPCIIEYQIDGLTTVCPKLEFDKPIERPLPLLSDEEFNLSFNSLRK